MTAIESINNLLDEMRHTLLLVSVPPDCIKIKEKKHRIDACNRAFDWLHNLKMSNEYEDYLKARALLPERTWQKYTLFNLIGLREQAILAKAAGALLKKWNAKRPALFQREKNEHTKNTR